MTPCLFLQRLRHIVSVSFPPLLRSASRTYHMRASHGFHPMVIALLYSQVSILCSPIHTEHMGVKPETESEESDTLRRNTPPAANFHGLSSDLYCEGAVWEVWVRVKNLFEIPICVSSCIRRRTSEVWLRFKPNHALCCTPHTRVSKSLPMVDFLKVVGFLLSLRSKICIPDAIPDAPRFLISVEIWQNAYYMLIYYTLFQRSERLVETLIA